MQLILFGAPGVGKGTQAKILTSTLGLKHISTGDIIRSEIKKRSEFGRISKELIDKGNLVPDKMMVDVIREAINEALNYKGFILDGFPRTKIQAVLLKELFNELNLPLPPLITLNARDEVIIKRLTQRRTCSNCGMIVNLNDLFDKDCCPSCYKINSFLIRDDDNETVIRHRLNVYREWTKPVIEYLQGEIKIFEIEATLSVDVVTHKIMSIINCNL